MVRRSRLDGLTWQTLRIDQCFFNDSHAILFLLFFFFLVLVVFRFTGFVPVRSGFDFVLNDGHDRAVHVRTSPQDRNLEDDVVADFREMARTFIFLQTWILKSK